jgi:hypothetical protein
MKTFKIVFFVVFLLLSSNTISAQYNNGYGGGGYGGNGYGNGGGYGGRNSQMSQMQSQPSAPKPVPVEETAGKIVAYYKKELNLDALQEIVVTNIYVKSMKKEEILMKKEISDDEKKEEFKVLGEMTDMQIIEILNKDQKEKYKNLVEDRKSKMEARRH